MKDWFLYANCRGESTERFFQSAVTREGKEIVKICEACPVRRWCLSAALRYERNQTRSERAGIWGGLTANERHVLWSTLKKRRTVDYCKNDHAMTPENVYVRMPDGWRECRQCRRINQKELTRRRRVS